MTLQSETPLDATDWNILRELQQDARLSYNELGRRVALSAPAVAERVRKLEDRGVITGYAAQIDPAQVGLPLLAFIQLQCDAGKCLLRTSSAEAFPEIREMYKLSGGHCALLKVAVASMQHLEALNERLGDHGRRVVNIVTSTAMSNRPIDWENPDVDMNPPPDVGWK
ncbi:MAG: Lrp/AsnC family transcriptional regulator [Chloroflexi bacterium]|nr:Lrp/AsnC family transcriptional regulator [Chloroflexota bacterium]MCC6897284.1 Lrp/AsnC family transcriptional regulator [Anaerolineae bacterium]